MRPAVAGDLGHPLLQLVGREVDDPRELAELVPATHPDAGGEVAARVLAGGLHHLLERPGERGGEEQGHEPGGDEGEEEGERRRPPEGAALLRDGPERARQPGHPPHLSPVAHRHRGVEEVRAEGRAAALGLAHPPGQGLADLGPPRVVLEGGELSPRHRRVREDPAVGRDHRHPRPHVAGRLVDQGVEGLRPRASGEGVLHHPGHEPRLGGEGLARLADGSSLQRGAGEQQQGGERDRGGHHRRQHHAPAQRQTSPHASPSRATR